MQKVTQSISGLIDFMKGDIWRVRLRDLPPKKSFLIRQVRIFLLALRGFDENKCLLRASALTFYSLISIVPVVAMVFGIAKGFGFEKRLEGQLMQQFQGQEEAITRVIGFAHTMLSNTKGGLIAGVGIVLLLWAVIKVLGHIEASFNDIWGVQDSRRMSRKFSDYLSVMLLCPMLLVLSSSVTVFITTQVTMIVEKVALLGSISPVIFFVLKLLPYCIVWVLFSFLYLFMPNTRVRFRSGILAGIIAGTLYQIVQLGYIGFQVGTAKYNAIYGSFAALPLFLIWMQVSWLIVLFGAELSFAHQNVHTYEFEPDSLRISHSFRRLLSLQVTHMVVVNFMKGEAPPTAEDICHHLEIPIRLTNQILHDLTECGVMSIVRHDDDGAGAYQPSCDINRLTIRSVIDSLEDQGLDTIPMARTEALQSLSTILDIFRKENERSPSNRLLKDIEG